MKTHLINDYIVEVPNDMSVSLQSSYDAILYRGIEITTLCSDDPEGTPYNGLYSILWDDAEPEVVLTLAEAKALIDAYFSKLPPRSFEQDMPENEFTPVLEADFEDDLGFSAVM